jgi:hypothetical protein
MLDAMSTGQTGAAAAPENRPAASPGQANPLSDDPVLLDMYMAALNAVFAEPEIVVAFGEFGLSAARLRVQMLSGAGRVLRTAVPEFAAYEEALTRSATTFGIDPKLIPYGSRRNLTSFLRLLVGSAGAGGAILVTVGLVGARSWSPADALVGAGGALLAVAAIVEGAWRAIATKYGRALMEGIARSDEGVELILARHRLMTAVGMAELLAQVRTSINTARQDRFDHEYSVSTSPGLSEVYDSINRVPTEVSTELEGLLARLDGASIGVAGPRGSGKSMLIREYCEDAGTPAENSREAGGRSLRSGSSENATRATRDLRCMVAAPVDYAAKDFVLHLFATFCRAVIRGYGRKPQWTNGEIPADHWLRLAGGLVSSLLLHVVFFGGGATGLLLWPGWIARHLSVQPVWVRYAAIAVICVGSADLIRSWVSQVRHWSLGGEEDLASAARVQLSKVRYLQTYTSGLSGGVSIPGGAQGQLSRGVSRAEQPLSYPEIVDEFRTFARSVAASVHQRGSRVFIGVDELDKIGSAEQAERFLNEIKGIFGIPHLYFIVSVSDDALTAFERRGLPLRDAFDSSFDEIIHVGPLSYPESRRLLYRRVVGLSEPYVALCHCLAGGLARDLIRTARNVVRTAADLGGPSAAMNTRVDIGNAADYVLASERPAPQPLTIGAIADNVVCSELRRKLRAVIHVASSTGSPGTTELLDLFYDITGRLSTHQPIASLIDLLDKPGPAESTAVAGLRLDFAAYAYYCATLQEVFTDQLDGKQIITATSEPNSPASFDTLADARNAFALDTMLAWRLITQFRAAWSIETREPPHQQPSRLV